MPSLYEQLVSEQGIDPIAAAEYAQECELAWHYASLHAQTLRDMERFGHDKPNLIQDAERRARKCEAALMRAYELSVSASLSG